MQLKSVPEDFVVVELPLREPTGAGDYLLLELVKRNITTERALSELAHALDLPRKAIGYAGTKDARALTRQRVTIRAQDTIKDRIATLKRGAWSVRVIGRDIEPLSLGLLKGNRFELIVRSLTENETAIPIASYPNYFDEQRFSTANVPIGHAILAGEYLKAAELIITTDAVTGERMRDWLDGHPNDAVTALRLVPKHTLLMYVHAYQSSIYNEILTRWLQSQDPAAQIIEGPVRFVVTTKPLPVVSVPMVGFGSELEAPFDSWYEELLARDGLVPRDFVVRALPFLTLEGTMRQSAVPITDLDIGPREPDDLHPGLEKQRITFSLPKGAYATLAIKCIYRIGDIRGGEQRND